MTKYFLLEHISELVHYLPHFRKGVFLLLPEYTFAQIFVLALTLVVLCSVSPICRGPDR